MTYHNCQLILFCYMTVFSGLAAWTNPITSLGKCSLSRAWQHAEQDPQQKLHTALLHLALHTAEKRHSADSTTSGTDMWEWRSMPCLMKYFGYLCCSPLLTTFNEQLQSLGMSQGCARGTEGSWRWNFILWMELVRGGFGKLLTVRHSFLTMWFKIRLARTTSVLPFDLVDGEKQWSEEALKQSCARPCLSPIRLEHTPQVTPSWTRQVLQQRLLSSHPNILEPKKIKAPHYYAHLYLFYCNIQCSVWGRVGSLLKFSKIIQLSHQKNFKLFYHSPFFVKFQENLPDFIELFNFNGNGWNFFFQLDVSTSHKKCLKLFDMKLQRNCTKAGRIILQILIYVFDSALDKFLKFNYSRHIREAAQKKVLSEKVSPASAGVQSCLWWLKASKSSLPFHMPKPLESTWNFEKSLSLSSIPTRLFFPFTGYILLICLFTKKNHQSHIPTNTILSFLFPL